MPSAAPRPAGIRVSVIALLGLGGPELSAEHAEATGRAVSAMDPRYLSLLTLMLVPGTSLHQQYREGEFQLLEPAGLAGRTAAGASSTWTG